MNRILIIGLGSIGQRHLQALNSIGEKNIAALRTLKGNLQSSDLLRNAIIEFFEIEKALAWQPTHIIISNPTSLHLDYLIKTVGTDAKIFVEKPIVDNYDLLIKDKLLYDKLLQTEILVGYNLRYHSLFQKIKKIIRSNSYGRPVSAYLHVGHYLPSWHPYENYADSYVAKKEMGGGALRTLSHELDLAQFFFGPFEKLFAKSEKISSIQITTDDTVDIIARNEICARVVIHLDLLSPVIRRYGFIHFEKGLLEYDFIGSNIDFTSYNTKNKIKIYKKNEDNNLQYIKQMRNFIFGGSRLGCTFEEGLEISRVIKYCELSSVGGIEQCLV